MAPILLTPVNDFNFVCVSNVIGFTETAHMHKLDHEHDNLKDWSLGNFSLLCGKGT